ncbi:hypothetical protein ACG83_30725 [Frankia sp. R43]|nr:hypothetical protein ACG83_30725 [Frankia sp. R43]
MDEPAGLALGILSALVAVGAEVLVGGLVVKQVPGSMVRETATEDDLCGGLGPVRPSGATAAGSGE